MPFFPPTREELWNSELFATVGELAGAWQGLRAKVRQSSHRSVQFGAVAVAVDVAGDKCAPIPRERGRLMREPGMTDTRAVTTASQGAREAQLIKGQKKVYARQGRAY